jgi:hypothetical protein
MPHRLRAVGALALVLLGLAGLARADDERAAAPVRSESSRLPLRRAPAAPGGGVGGSGWGWPLGGVTVILAALGWASLAARRPGLAGAREAGALRIIGRTPLGPKQAVYLLRAGDRILIVGTGPGGPPSLLATMPEFPPDGPAAGGPA